MNIGWVKFKCGHKDVELNQLSLLREDSGMCLDCTRMEIHILRDAFTYIENKANQVLEKSSG